MNRKDDRIFTWVAMACTLGLFTIGLIVLYLYFLPPA